MILQVVRIGAIELSENAIDAVRSGAGRSGFARAASCRAGVLPWHHISGQGESKMTNQIEF